MMTRYRPIFVALAAAFVLSACSGDNNDMKTEDKAAGAATEQAVDAAEQTMQETTEANDEKPADDGAATTQEADSANDGEQTTTAN